ncbi:MAG: hypothetical protein VW362_08400 [Candidatus Nanopelagicales bacterium]
MSVPSRILMPDGSYIERVVHPFGNSQNKGKVKYKRDWWRVYRKGVQRDWELKEPLEGEHRVYVLRLKKQVWDREENFRERNPDYRDGKPLVYVGHTSKTIEERLADHLEGGETSSRLVRKYFRRTMPGESEDLPVYRSRRKALMLEQETADELRSRGWGVWEGKVEDLNLDGE